MPRTYIRHERAPKGSRDSRYFRVYAPQFITPFFWAAGASEPEHMVAAELMRRGIHFEWMPQRNSIGGGVPADWEIDFLFPRHKIALEVQGSYFHTLPDQMRHDALRFAMIEAAGWRPLFFWEWDIRTRLTEKLDEVPEFYQVKPMLERGGRRTPGLPFYFGGTGIDRLAGLRTALRNRGRPDQYLFRRQRRRRPK